MNKINTQINSLTIRVCRTFDGVQTLGSKDSCIHSSFVSCEIDIMNTLALITCSKLLKLNMLPKKLKRNIAMIHALRCSELKRIENIFMNKMILVSMLAM